MHCIMFAVPFVVFVQMQQSYVPSIVSISHSGSDFTGIARLSPHRCNCDHSCTTPTAAAVTTGADGTLLRSCSVDSSSFARLKAVVAQFLLTASLQKNDSTKSNVIFVDKFARLFVVQQGSFGHSISSRKKNLKLDGHTEEQYNKDDGHASAVINTWGWTHSL